MAAPVTSTFDPIAYKATTQEQWQAAAEAWHRWGPTIEQWLGEATETMLDLAGVGEGARVPDVAAGAGGQTLTAARRVGPAGRVLASDIAPGDPGLRRGRGPPSRAGQRGHPGWPTWPPGPWTASSSTSIPGPTTPSSRGWGSSTSPTSSARSAGCAGRCVPAAGWPRSCIPPLTATSSSPCRSQSFAGARSSRRLPAASQTRSASAALVCSKRHSRRPGSATWSPGLCPRRCGWPRRLTCPVRAGVVRRAAPDARRPGRARSGGGLDGDSRGARPVRRLQRVRGPVRDAGGCRDQVGLIASAALI